jgi:hypothetical protein
MILDNNQINDKIFLDNKIGVFVWDVLIVDMITLKEWDTA